MVSSRLNAGWVNAYMIMSLWKMWLIGILLLPESPPHGLIVHVWLVLVLAPKLWNSLGVHQLKDAFFTLCPLDVFGTGVFILQQSQEEFPKVDGVACKLRRLILSHSFNIQAEIQAFDQHYYSFICSVCIWPPWSQRINYCCYRHVCACRFERKLIIASPTVDYSHLPGAVAGRV